MNRKDWEAYIYGLDVAPRGTQTASQQSSDLTKKGEDMNPSSDSKTNAAENPTLDLEDEPSLDLNKPVPLDPKTGSAESDSKGADTSWLIFKAPKTELCQHDKIGFCRKCDTADLADLQDAVSLLQSKLSRKHANAWGGGQVRSSPVRRF